MTKEESAWLEYRSKKTGKSVEELRQDMSNLSKKADPKKRGFAVLSQEQREAIWKKSAESRKKKEQ